MILYYYKVMSISRDEIQRIAKLARIELTEEEMGRFQGDLNKVLGYIEVLKAINTEGVAPLASVTGLENTWREDEEADLGLQKAIIENAPEKSGRFIKVKKVL